MSLSLSARRAWIEISQVRPMIVTSRVALRKESVDRNRHNTKLLSVGPVALRKESVDRNKDACQSAKLMYQSLSARRAWIEMTVA